MGSKLSGLRKKLSEENIKFIVSSAKKGSSRRSIARALDMHPNIWKRRPDIEEIYQKGLDELRDEIASKSIKSDDYRDRAMLFSRLNILSEPIYIDKIDSIASLQKAMGHVLVAFSGGKINPEQLNSFTKSCAQLSQLYFDQNVQAQLDELKEQLKHKVNVVNDYA